MQKINGLGNSIVNDPMEKVFGTGLARTSKTFCFRNIFALIRTLAQAGSGKISMPRKRARNIVPLQGQEKSSRREAARELMSSGEPGAPDGSGGGDFFETGDEAFGLRDGVFYRGQG